MDQDEQLARRTLLVLDEEPDTPSTVDVHRALAEGRRRTRRRTVVRAAAFAMTTGLVAGASLGVAVHRHHPDGGVAEVVPSILPYVSPSVSQAAQAPPAPTTCAVHVLPARRGTRASS
jgi:hypothetical protein